MKNVPNITHMTVHWVSMASVNSRREHARSSSMGSNVASSRHTNSPNVISPIVIPPTVAAVQAAIEG